MNLNWDIDNDAELSSRRSWDRLRPIQPIPWGRKGMDSQSPDLSPVKNFWAERDRRQHVSDVVVSIRTKIPEEGLLTFSHREARQLMWLIDANGP